MASDDKNQWKETLNLPQTGFPMKAQLNQKEPVFLKKWNSEKIYEKILASRKDKEMFILHDGPPYANGSIHLGTALNKILKDFVVKSKTMDGFCAPYVPGWDCHGLPIEIKVEQQLGGKRKDMTTLQVREKCREYAEKFINVQREEFMRLGILGNWQDPYTTLKHEYEARIINCFNSFVKKGNITRKKRPVYWCISCGTALAEAEVEYANHSSPSIYVKFPLRDIPDFLKEFKDKTIFVMIWTTTPWTIPANLAIAVHPEYEYSLFEIKGEYYITATRLMPVIAEIQKAGYKKLKEFKGSELKGLNAIHPLYDRNSLIITADYVALDTGTGCVHTAPGHGEEDYVAGLQYGIDIYSPVDGHGCFDETTGIYKGLQVFQANDIIVNDLREKQRLFHTEKIDHSYPHCWRCKKPVIFRATEQWFIAMDAGELRQKALKKIRECRWLPDWGEERIYSMVENRPDWCISRQRDWGVPIPVFYCEKCNEPLVDSQVIDQVEKVFSQKGSNSWYSSPTGDFIPQGKKCSKCGHSEFRKSMDIVDVWFESGASWGILEQYPGHRFPADLYLEGGDQYRGWFHSSLLVAVSAMNNAPYKMVISHGWALDDKGRAMSKSLGNTIQPMTIIKDMGAEILRIWVAMVNYQEDVKLGDELLQRISESYRKIRNTWRFMLGVISDFNPDTDRAPDGDLGEIDRYVLSRFQELKEKILQQYRNYEYHQIFHAISNFFTNDLSAFYLNVMKDNLYCNAPASKIRRATQTVIFKLTHETLKLMAPILSFTAEEAWEFLPKFKGKEDSIHLSYFPQVENQYVQTEMEAKWNIISGWRDRALKEIEDARQVRRIIGDSLEAKVVLELPPESYNLLLQNKQLFNDILVISELELVQADMEKITVLKTGGKKCPRCWNRFLEDSGSELCPRCSQVTGK